MRDFFTEYFIGYDFDVCSNNNNNDNNQNQFSTQDGSTMTMQVVSKRGVGSTSQWWYCIKDGSSGSDDDDHFSGLLVTSSLYTKAWLRAALGPSCALKAVCQAEEEVLRQSNLPTSTLLSEILR